MVKKYVIIIKVFNFFDDFWGCDVFENFVSNGEKFCKEWVLFVVCEFDYVMVDFFDLMVIYGCKEG